MPSLAQFDDTAAIFDSPAVRGGDRMIYVGGPLKGLDPTSDMPMTVDFQVVQSPKDEHDPAQATRVLGSVTRVGNGRWEAVVPANRLQPGSEARGIGILVVANMETFAYETFTWCDHIEIEEATVADVEAKLSAASLAEVISASVDGGFMGPAAASTQATSGGS